MSVLISSLPTWTGSAADLRYFIMNNAAENQTFKFSGYTSPFKYGDGTNTVISNNYVSNQVPGAYAQILGGFGNTQQASSGFTFTYGAPTIVGGYNLTFSLPGDQLPNTQYGHIMLGGEGNTLSGRFNGSNNAMLGGKNNYMNSVYGENTIIGGVSCTIQGNGQNTIIGSSNSTINGTDRHGIFGGQGHTINSSGYAYIFGGQGHTLSGSLSVIVGGANSADAGTNAGFIGGGRYNSLGGGNSDSNYIVGGQYATAEGINSGILGGWGTYIYDDGNSSDPYRRSNTIIGSPYSTIGVSSNNGRNFAGIFQSLYCTIPGTSASETKVATIWGSSGSTIQAGSTYSAILGGYNTTINDKDNVVMIGTSNRTSDADNTTYVENAHTFRTYSTAVQSVVSGSTFTCNLNNGGKAQFYLTANTTIDITNVRDGQSFIIKTQTNGNYTITWTATGYTFVFEGGIKDPGNTTTDLFVFEVFGSVIYGNRRHNYS